MIIGELKMNSKVKPLGAILPVILSGCSVLTSEKEIENKTTVRQPLTCIRLYSGTYSTPAKRAQVCRVLDQYGKPEEIWLSTAAGPDSLRTHKKVLKDCAEMARELRKRNIAVSIQLSSTIGHFGGKVYTAKDAFKWTQDDLLVGHDGKTSPGICCPSSPSFVQWCVSIFAMYCKELQPLTAYVDDDMRFHEHGKMKQTCCCKRCLDRFGKMTGRKWTVKQVHDMLESKKPQPFRKQWIRLHTEIIAEFMGKIAKAVHEVAPNTYVGIQNQHAKYFYSAWSFVPVFEAIQKETGLPARVRIGGGAWNGFDPQFNARKSFITGCDIDDAKASGMVDLLGHEEENWPCTVMNKSAYVKALESALHLAVGGNYLTYQSGDLWNDYESTMGELLSMIREWTPLFKRLRELSCKYKKDGITALVQNGITEQPAHKEFSWYVFWAQESEQMRLNSLPLFLSKVASDKGGNPGYLTWETARGIREETFKKFLRSGIVMTGNAYLELQKRGLTKDFKVTGSAYSRTKRAVFLKGPHAGIHWFWGGENAVAFSFEKDCKAEALMAYYKAPNKTAVWRLETPEGKIAVVGCPGDFNQNLSHLALDLYRDLFDWVGKNPVSVRLENPAPIILIPLSDENGKVRAVSLLNTGAAPGKNLRLQVRRSFGEKALWFQTGKKTVEVTGTADTSGDSCTFELPELGSWQFALLELQ